MNGCWDGPIPEPQIRTIEDMRDVLADPGCTSDQPLYFMYRDLARSESDRSGSGSTISATTSPSSRLALSAGSMSRRKGTTTPATLQGSIILRSTRFSKAGGTTSRHTLPMTL